MRKTITTVLGCLITCALTIAGILYMGRLLDPRETTDSINSIKAFHSLEKNSVDVCFYGSSHVWKGCDVNAFEDTCGLSGYNYAGNWQAFNTTLLFMRDSFRTQTPKVAFVDTYVVYHKLVDVEMEGQIYYTRAISSFPGKKEYLNDCFGNNWKRYVTYYMPLIMFHDNWSEISKENFIAKKSVSDFVKSRGYDNSTEITPTDLSKCINGTQKALNDTSLEMLDSMVSLCRENGTVLIFYTCPYEGEYEYADAMAQYASDHDCDYINLIDHMDDMGLDGSTDFRDTKHLNDSGAAKLSKYLGKYLLENYTIR